MKDKTNQNKPKQTKPHHTTPRQTTPRQTAPQQGKKKTNKKITCFEEHVDHVPVPPRGRAHERGDAVAATVVRRRPALQKLLEHVFSALARGQPEGGHPGLSFGVDFRSRLWDN